MQDKLIFAGRTIDEVYLLQGRKKAPFAPVRRKITSRGSVHRLKKTTYDLLEITQPIGFRASTKEKALEISDRLSTWLVKEGIAPLEFPDEPGRKYMAVVEGTLDDLNKRSVLWEGTIRFLCFESKGSPQNLNLVSEYQIFNIRGQKEANWTSTTVFGSAQTTFRLECKEGGLINLKYNFITGDSLKIDYRFRSVKLNGINLSQSILLDTEWFMLRPGDLNIKASHSTKIDYDETYY